MAELAQGGIGRIALAAALVVAIGAAVPERAAAQEAIPGEAPAPSDCTWPAAGGAIAGLAVGWYGFVGLYALGGGSAFELEPTTGNVAAILALEWLGMVGGATAACAIWGDEDRWLPTAGPVITGGLLGGGAGVALGFLVIEAGEIDRNTDNPVASAMILLTGATLGLLGGGYLGFALDRAVRGPPGGTLTVTPTASPTALGLELAYAP